jgi:hypothetical protein
LRAGARTVAGLPSATPAAGLCHLCFPLTPGPSPPPPPNPQPHPQVQENCIDLVGRIADRGAEYVPAREWMRICFELLDMLKAHKKAIRRATVNTFGYIAKAIGPQVRRAPCGAGGRGRAAIGAPSGSRAGASTPAPPAGSLHTCLTLPHPAAPPPSPSAPPPPQDVLVTLLNNLKVQERQNRVCTTVAIAIVAETCQPFTVLPALMNEYRTPELNVQNGVLKVRAWGGGGGWRGARGDVGQGGMAALQPCPNPPPHPTPPHPTPPHPRRCRSCSSTSARWARTTSTRSRRCWRTR